MNILTVFLLSISIFPDSSEKNRIIYFDANWVETQADAATFKREIVYKDSLFVVTDFVLADNKKLNITSYKDEELTIKHGYEASFYNNGNLASERDYIDNEQTNIKKEFYHD